MNEQKTAERFANTDRDDATVGVKHERNVDPKLADKDQPTWQPPESQPEPRPADPVMDSSLDSSARSPDTH